MNRVQHVKRGSTYEVLGQAEAIARARVICDTGTPSQRHALLNDILAATALRSGESHE